MMLSYVATGSKEPLPRKKTSLPLHKVKADATWGGETLFKNMNFHDFPTDQTYCGKKRKVFAMNPTGADYHPI